MDNNYIQNKVKIAHIILVHQWPDQLKKLVSVLAHPNVRFFIHVDKKSEEKPFLEALKGVSNVYFIKNRIDVVWGGFSLIEAVLEAMEEIVRQEQFSHVNLISGADYPLTNAQEFVDFIQENPDKQFFEYYPVETEWTEAIPRYTNYHFPELKFKGKYFLEKVANAILPKRKIPYGMIPVGRLAWFTITIDLVKYFLQTFNEKKKITSFFRLTWGTDEMIFQTLAYNSPFKEQMVNNPLRYIQFPSGKAHPKTLTISDINTLYLRKYFFARKFHPIDSEELMLEIDKKINS